MNASKGLQRVSAVWWAGVGLMFTSIPLFVSPGAEKLYSVAVPPIAYVLHWLTCWIVKGFFGDGE